MPDVATWRLPARYLRIRYWTEGFVAVSYLVIVVILPFFWSPFAQIDRYPIKLAVAIFVFVVGIPLEYLRLAFVSGVTIETDGTIVFHRPVGSVRVRPDQLVAVSGVLAKDAELFITCGRRTFPIEHLLKGRDELVERLKALNPAVKIERF